jgi:hypothetical protein
MGDDSVCKLLGGRVELLRTHVCMHVEGLGIKRRAYQLALPLICKGGELPLLSRANYLDHQKASTQGKHFDLKMQGGCRQSLSVFCKIAEKTQSHCCFHITHMPITSCRSKLSSSSWFLAERTAVPATYSLYTWKGVTLGCVLRECPSPNFRVGHNWWHELRT